MLRSYGRGRKDSYISIRKGTPALNEVPPPTVERTQEAQLATLKKEIFYVYRKKLSTYILIIYLGQIIHTVL